MTFFNDLLVSPKPASRKSTDPGTRPTDTDTKPTGPNYPWSFIRPVLASLFESLSARSCVGNSTQTVCLVLTP